MQKTIIANWKMHLGIRESVALAKAAVMTVQGKDVIPNIILCPAFTALYEVHKVLARTRLTLGAQDVGPDRYGAYTGAVGVGHLEDIGCATVLLGHSERRIIFGESEELLRKKLQAIAGSHIKPVLCVGETRGEYEAGTAVEAVRRTMRRICAAAEVPKGFVPMFAYEPLWAIGTKQTPPIADVLLMVQAIKEEAEDLFSSTKEKVQVLYGGSVDEQNAYMFLREPEIDGVLVGSASLHIHAFQDIVRAATDVLTFQE